ncbi:MAG: Permease of the major facilitator superfamily [Thermoleophilia bacterium]|nr:Permease of the major facilitator superfamily [Thermoleophilia bacterium]
MNVVGLATETEPAPSRVAAAAWALFDFGYSLFAFVVFARYLGDWLITDLGHPDYVYTSAQAVAALALLVLMPLAGVIADLMGRHVPLLALFVLVAAVCGVLLSVVPPDVGSMGVFPILAIGTVSAIATALSFAQFDPLLPKVVVRAKWDTMSGVAVAAGYAGIVAWLVLLAELVVGEGDKQAAFLPAGIIFLLSAVPLLLLVRERPLVAPDVAAAVEPGHVGVGVVRAAWRRLQFAIDRLREHPQVLRLLAGRFLYTDAVGTVNIYAIIYIGRVGDFTEREKNLILLFVVAFAGLGAIGAGRLSRHLGPRRTLLRVMPLFALGIAVVAAAGAPWTVWVLAPVVGITLGTVYTVDRVFMLALTPPELRGELFGFFNLIGRVAQALGPFILWGGTIWLLHDATDWLSALDASRVSLGLLAVSTLAGLWVIRPLRDGTEVSARSAS